MVLQCDMRTWTVAKFIGSEKVHFGKLLQV